jgi:hypothetical protein
MVIFPAQLDGFSSRGDGVRIIKLSTYQEHAIEVSKATNMEIGTEFMVMLIPTSEKEEIASFASETKEETLLRFKKRMEALITDIANQKGIGHEQYRTEIKEMLKEKGFITTSTKELDIEGYAQVISLLVNIQNNLIK